MRALARQAPLALVLLLLAGAAAGRGCNRRTPGLRAWVVDVTDPLATVGGTLPVPALEARWRRAHDGAVFAIDGQPAGAPTGGTAADVGHAIREASRYLIASGGGALLFATEGRDPFRNAVAALEDAARSGVTVDLLPLEVHRPEVALVALELPARVHAGEVFQALALVRSSPTQVVRVTLEREGRQVAQASELVQAGALHAVEFLLSAGEASATLVAYVSAAADSRADDDLARADLRVAGAPALAAVGYAGLAGRAERLDRLPSAEDRERYDALYLRLAAESLPSTAEQAELARWVAAGHGLVVSCDDPAVALQLRGGPLEELLPVRLEPPEPDDAASAVVVLVDRSGSMDRAEDAGSGLDIAFEAAAALAALLGPEDRYGLIAFDVGPHVLRPLCAVGREPSSAAPALDPAGGTDWGAALGLALDWLAPETAGRRHVVLIGDGLLAPGADGDPGRDWPDGVTLSTVSVGDRADQERLARLAADHGGQHRHVARAEELPGALRREGARLRPPTQRSGPLSVEATPRFAGLLPAVSIGPERALLVARPRPEAERALHASSGDLVLAFRQVGWGRTAFLSADPASLVADRAGAPAALVLATLERVLPAERSAPAGASVTFDGWRTRIDWRLEEGLADWPSGQIRFAGGETHELRPEPVDALRARAVVVPAAAGRSLLETAGGRWSVWPSLPERGLPAQARGWAERWAAAGGGVVLTPDDVEDWRPSGAPRRSRISTAPWLIALAALVAFADLCLHPARRTRVVRRGTLETSAWR